MLAWLSGLHDWTCCNSIFEALLNHLHKIASRFHYPSSGLLKALISFGRIFSLMHESFGFQSDLIHMACEEKK